MLNCVNALEQHMPINEQSGLVVAEEKCHQQESCECQITSILKILSEFLRTTVGNPFEDQILQMSYNLRRHTSYYGSLSGILVF